MDKLLEKLRARLAKLETRASETQAEIQDGIGDAEVRAIEARHAEILDEVEEVRGLIADREAELAAAEAGDGDEGQRAAPADADAAATRAVAAERTRIAEIRRIGSQANIADDEVARAITDGIDPDKFLQRAFEVMAERDRSTPTHPARIVRDERETQQRGMVLAMSRGFGGPELGGADAEMARSYMGHIDVVEFAAEAIGHRGHIRTVREREEVLARAFHTTSDFPAIFSEAINVTMEARYATAPQTYRRIARRRDFMDFRPHYAVGIGEFPMLSKLTEAGEIRFGTFGESKEQVAVVPYARGLRISRQALVNDRLGAIGDIMGGYGRTVSRFEELTFYTMMLAATTKLSDGKVVFHADHANLAAAGTAIDDTNLGKARAAMRKQKGLDDAVLNLQPRILLVSPDKETEARKAVTAIVANQTANVNQFSFLEPLVAGDLTGNAWYLFADPADAAVYQWGLLDGYTAPRVRFDEPFGTQGIGMTVEHDFGVGAIDYRGGYKNPGT